MIVGPRNLGPFRPMSGASAMAISSFIMKYCQKDQPSPPYSCGQCAASQPLAPTFCVKPLASWIYSSDSLSNTNESFQPCGSSAFRKSRMSWRNSSSARDQLKSMTGLLSSPLVWGHRLSALSLALQCGEGERVSKDLRSSIDSLSQPQQYL